MNPFLSEKFKFRQDYKKNWFVLNFFRMGTTIKLSHLLTFIMLNHVSLNSEVENERVHKAKNQISNRKSKIELRMRMSF